MRMIAQAATVEQVTKKSRFIATVTRVGSEDEARAALPRELAGTVTFEAVEAAEVDALRASFDLALFSSSL